MRASIKTQVRSCALIFLFVLAGPQAAWAKSISIDPSSSEVSGAPTGVWNTELGVYHPPLRVYRYMFFLDPTEYFRDIDVGDGAHGVFDSSTYASFSENGDISGNVIRLDTDAYPELNVTSFHLESGWTLRPVGSNPLVIRSWGSVKIDSLIDCSGTAGEDVNPSETIGTQGGIGLCGGGDGGNGGPVAVAGDGDGQDGGANVSGGGAGPSENGSGGLGGGGGGAYSEDLATAGGNPAGGSAGNAGVNFTDHAFSEVGAGSGGGGGFEFTTGLAAANSSGGAGGGGGGYVWIVSGEDILVSATGSVLANGGNGGGDLAAAQGGGGGGGGGGSIAFFARRDVILNGPVRALGGTGGATSGGDGGDGADGRTWITDSDGDSFGIGELPGSVLIEKGDVLYKTGTYEAITPVIDLNNSRPKINSSVIDGSAGTGNSIQAYIASGSSSDFTPQWQDLSDFTGEIERYVQFRFQIINADETQDAYITGLDVEYEDFVVNEFDFEGACGASGDGPGNGLWLLVVPLFLALCLRRFYHSKPNRASA